MKKILTIIAAVFLYASVSNVSAQNFTKESMVGSAGLGFGWYGYGYGFGVTSLPFISVGFEKGIVDIPKINSAISVGGILGYKHASWTYYNTKGSFNDIVIAARGAIHADLFKVEKLDTYAGVTLGFRIHKENFNYAYYDEYNHTYTVEGLYAGARYYLTDKLAGYAELGVGTGYFNIGLSLKLK